MNNLFYLMDLLLALDWSYGSVHGHDTLRLIEAPRSSETHLAYSRQCLRIGVQQTIQARSHCSGINFTQIRELGPVKAQPKYSIRTHNGHKLVLGTCTGESTSSIHTDGPIFVPHTSLTQTRPSLEPT